MNKKFVDLLRAKFAAGLAVKTGWGRVEVLSLFERCVAEAAVEAMDAMRQLDVRGAAPDQSVLRCRGVFDDGVMGGRQCKLTEGCCLPGCPATDARPY